MGLLSRLEKPALNNNDPRQVFQSSTGTNMPEDSLESSPSPLIILIALRNDSGMKMLDKASRWKFLQRIKEDCIWFLGNLNKRISKVSIIAIDNEKTFDGDEPFLKAHYDLMDIRTESRNEDYDSDLFSGIVCSCNPRPLIVVVDCENDTNNVGLENAMTWVGETDAEGIYKLELGFTVFAYMKAKDAGHMGNIYETDGHLKKKENFAKEEPRAAPVLEANGSENFDALRRSFFSSSTSSEEKVGANIPIQPELVKARMLETAAAAESEASDGTPSQNKNTTINRFTGIQDIYHQYGANPCHVFHMMQGHCNKLDCNHLHDEISFTPEALATYRAYLARHPCPYANKCKYAERGNCFYNHVCPLGASCSRPACGYLHGGEAPKIKVPAGNIGLIPTINRRVLGNPERALPVHTHTSTADPEEDLKKAWEDDAQPAHRPKDFIPLVKAIFKLAERRGSPKVTRSQVGVFLNSSHSWPIGFGRYSDFKHYTHSASRFGYVLLGSDDVIRTGNEWIQSTGILERACGVEPYQA